jgi:hypothetical protein
MHSMIVVEPGRRLLTPLVGPTTSPKETRA